MIKRNTQKGRKVIRECQVCRQLFEALQSEINRGYGKVCSRRCAGRAGARRWHAVHDATGEGNPNYKGEAALTSYQHKCQFRLRYPEKAAAHDAVRNARLRGALTPQPCEVCGATEDIHAHHDDYSKPLEVRWLCARCHRIEHGATN